MRVVLDTNVLVSGLLNPNGNPAVIIDLLLNDKLQLLYDSRILQEYTEVLHRKKFGFDQEYIEPIISFFEDFGEIIASIRSDETFEDDDDRMFYEVAQSGRAEYLITGNASHFPKRSWIVSPADFVGRGGFAATE